MIPWTSLIAFYLWLAGMAGGAYFIAFLAERLGLSEEDGLLKAATWMGVLAVAFGSLLLTLDLGNPLRFWHLLSVFSTLSPMSIGAWLLPIWALIGALMIGLWWLKKWTEALKVLAWINFFLSVLLITYTGVLLSATNQPLWSETLLLPPLFVVSAISTGIGFLVITLLLKRRTSVHTLNLFGRIDPVVTTIELVILVAFLVALGATRTAITAGTLGLLFWVGAVLIGVLVPLGLGWRARVRGREGGFAALLAALWTIVGGLVLRAVIVLGGQIHG